MTTPGGSLMTTALSGSPRGTRVLQRVVFPPSGDFDVVPLYAEVNMDRGAAELGQEKLAASLGHTSVNSATLPAAIAAGAAVGETQSSIRFGTDVSGLAALSGAGRRRSAEIREGCRVSFATYFNAFPASYWRRWTTVDRVTLRLRLAGQATVVLYRSTARGDSHPVETIDVPTDDPRTIERTLPLAPFIDGGWYWFDVVAGPRGTTLIAAEWTAPDQPDRTGRLSLGITTFNRPDFMLDQLRALSDASEVLDLIDTIYVADQGTIRLTEQPGFATATAKLGDKLRVIPQGNLGGSGGFSRVMDETMRAGVSDYLLILDDDIRWDPEGILRAVTFADLSRRPTIVGGHMFSLYDRTVLHAFAEAITPGPYWWGPAPNTKTQFDFGRRNLRNTPWLHRRADADYNGWWMCLIPTKVIRESGLALPVFIKWDDAEYALRARARGYPTVSMPGMAAWHVPWFDKNDAVDHQAYYHLRNRMVVALLHSPFKRGGRIGAESAERVFQNLVSMQYSTAEMRLLAIEDLLSGPGHLHRDLATKMGELKEIRARYADAQSSADLETFPRPRGRAADNLKTVTTPTGKGNLVRKAVRALLHQFRKPRPGARKRPQLALPHQDAAWWVLCKLDSALVSAADGTTAAWYQRDRKLFRSMMWRSTVLHVKLLWRWPKLAAEYRAAAPEFTSPRQWRETFEASLDYPSRR